MAQLPTAKDYLAKLEVLFGDSVITGQNGPKTSSDYLAIIDRIGTNGGQATTKKSASDYLAEIQDVSTRQQDPTSVGPLSPEQSKRRVESEIAYLAGEAWPDVKQAQKDQPAIPASRFDPVLATAIELASTTFDKSSISEYDYEKAILQLGKDYPDLVVDPKKKAEATHRLKRLSEYAIPLAAEIVNNEDPEFVIRYAATGGSKGDYGAPDEHDFSLLLQSVRRFAADKGENRGKSFVGKIAESGKRGLAGLKTGIQAVGEDLEYWVGARPHDRSARADSPQYGLSDTDRLRYKAIKSAKDTDDPLTDLNDPFWKRWTIQAAEMAPPMAVGIATGGVAGPAAAAGIWFGPIYEDSRDDLLDRGASPKEARLIGAASAAVQSAIETINLNAFMPKGSLQKIKEGVRPFVWNAAKGYGKEIGEEGLQSLADSAAVEVASRINKEVEGTDLSTAFMDAWTQSSSSAGPLAVMMLPGFMGGLPRATRISLAKRLKDAEFANTVVNKDQPSRKDIPELPKASDRAELHDALVEASKPKPTKVWDAEQKEIRTLTQEEMAVALQTGQMTLPSARERSDKRQINVQRGEQGDVIEDTLVPMQAPPAAAAGQAPSFDQQIKDRLAALRKKYPNDKTYARKKAADAELNRLISESVAQGAQRLSAESAAAEDLADSDIQSIENARILAHRAKYMPVAGDDATVMARRIAGNAPQAAAQMATESGPPKRETFARAAGIKPEKAPGPVQRRKVANKLRDELRAAQESIAESAAPAASGPPPGTPDPRAGQSDTQSSGPRIGRPELANFGLTPDARARVDEIDEQRKQAGIPQPVSIEAIEAEAAQRIQQNRGAEMDKILGESPKESASDVAVVQQLYNEEARKAWAGDTDAIITANELAKKRREIGTEWGRKGVVMHDKIATPEERLQNIQGKMVELPTKMAEKLEKVSKPIRDRNNRRRQIEDEINRAWAKTAAAFGGSVGANIGNVGEISAAMKDLVLAYAKKGLLTAEEIIQDLAIKHMSFVPTKQFRDGLKSAIREARGEVAGIVDEQSAEKRRAQLAKERRAGERAKELVNSWARTMENYKRELRDYRGVDLDKGGLTPAEYKIALHHMKAFRADTLDKALELRRNVMLDAIATHLVNTVSTALHSGYIAFLRYPVSLAIRKAKNPGGVNLNEAVAFYENLFSKGNVLDAFRTAIQAFKTEIDHYEIERSSPITDSGEVDGDALTVSPFDVGGRGAAIRGRTGRIVRIPQRALNMEDQFFKTILGKAFDAAEANRLAALNGLKAGTAEYNQFMQKEMLDPTSNSRTAAIHLVREAVFQEPTKALNWINRIRGDGYGRLIQLVIPFTTTPWNTTRRGIKVAPGMGTVAMINDAMSGDDARMSRGVADQLLGWIGFAVILAWNDPEDENAIFRMTGTSGSLPSSRYIASTSRHKPMHAYFGPYGFDYSRMDPFSTFFALVVDTAERIKRAKGPEEALSIIDEYGRSLVSQLDTKTMLQGVADMMEAFRHWREEGIDAMTNWSASFAVSWVPNTVRTAMRAGDPYLKDSSIYGEGDMKLKNILENLAIRSGMDEPLGMDSQITYDIWGQPKSMTEMVDRPMTDFVWRLVSPIRTAHQEPFIGNTIIMRWNLLNPEQAYKPAPQRPYYNDGDEQVFLDKEQKAQLHRISGRYAAYKVDQLVKTGLIKNPENPTKADIDRVEKAVSQARSDVRRRLQRSWRSGDTISDEEFNDKYKLPLYHWSGGGPSSARTN